MQTKLHSKSSLLLRLAAITLGCALYAVSVSLFLNPNQLAPGGVSGIAILINHLAGFPTGTLILLLNIPLMLVGVWKLGFRFLILTIYAVGISSLMIDLLSHVDPLTHDPVLAAVFGGASLALGLGLVFKAGATTGGTDILVRLLKLRWRYIRTGSLFLLTDALIIAASALVFRKIDIALYAVIAAFINSTVFDLVIYGPDGAKMVFIITDKSAEITQHMLKELELGVTLLYGEGAYTMQDKRVIFCAMKKQLLPQVQELVRELDPWAFLIVTSANEVLGEGFKDHGAGSI